jgi:hypothetical protein
MIRVARSCNEQQLAETSPYSHSYSRLLPTSATVSRRLTDTPVLRCAPKRLPWVTTRCRSACLSGFRGRRTCGGCRRLRSAVRPRLDVAGGVNGTRTDDIRAARELMAQPEGPLFRALRREPDLSTGGRVAEPAVALEGLTVLADLACDCDADALHLAGEDACEPGDAQALRTRPRAARRDRLRDRPRVARSRGRHLARNHTITI